VPDSDAHRRAVERRERLVETAIRLFSERPYAEVSVQQIAADADVAIGLLYYHFTDKQGLYAAALETLAQGLREHVAAAVDPSEPPLERLTAELNARLEFVARHATGYRELLSGAPAHPRVREIVDRERADRLRVLVEAVAPEAPRTPTAMATLEGWLSFTDGVQLAWLERRDTSREEIVELCMRVLVASLDAAKQLAGY
jgi:AcrR family transcriptional regulator